MVDLLLPPRVDCRMVLDFYVIIGVYVCVPCALALLLHDVVSYSLQCRYLLLPLILIVIEPLFQQSSISYIIIIFRINLLN